MVDIENAPDVIRVMENDTVNTLSDEMNVSEETIRLWKVIFNIRPEMAGVIDENETRERTLRFTETVVRTVPRLKQRAKKSQQFNQSVGKPAEDQDEFIRQLMRYTSEYRSEISDMNTQRKRIKDEDKKSDNAGDGLL